VLVQMHPEQEQEWARIATRVLVGILGDERNTSHGLLWAGWKGCVVRWLGWDTKDTKFHGQPCSLAH